jgi:hypothetical protein
MTQGRRSAASMSSASLPIARIKPCHLERDLPDARDARLR